MPYLFIWGYPSSFLCAWTFDSGLYIWQWLSTTRRHVPIWVIHGLLHIIIIVPPHHMSILFTMGAILKNLWCNCYVLYQILWPLPPIVAFSSRIFNQALYFNDPHPPPIFPYKLLCNLKILVFLSLHELDQITKNYWQYPLVVIWPSWPYDWQYRSTCCRYLSLSLWSDIEMTEP